MVRCSFRSVENDFLATYELIEHGKFIVGQASCLSPVLIHRLEARATLILSIRSCLDTLLEILCVANLTGANRANGDF